VVHTCGPPASPGRRGVAAVALRSQAKTLVNRGLAPLGLRLQTRTAELAKWPGCDDWRWRGILRALRFPFRRSFMPAIQSRSWEAVAGFREQTARFARPGRDGGYSFD